jgi:hypothetical protein
MSASVFAFPIGKSSARVAVMEVTPFEQFALARRLGTSETHKFLKFVEHMGGSFYTDFKTLLLLFELWKEKGRP